MIFFLYLVATENNKKTTNRVDENSEDSQQQSRQQLEIKESIERMDRLAQVVGKMHEMREQRKTLMQRWRDELKLDNSKDVELEGRQPVVAPQDDVDLLRELGGGGGRPSAVDLMPSFRLFEVRLGEVVSGRPNYLRKSDNEMAKFHHSLKKTSLILNLY